MKLLDEFVAASQRKHLRYVGQGFLRGGIIRSAKVLLSARTGSPKNRFSEVRRIFDVNKASTRLREPRILPHSFVLLEVCEVEYLYALARYAKHGIVETGRFHGGSTLLMSAAAPDIPIWSIDIAPQDDHALKGYMSTLGIGQRVRLIVGDSTHDHPEVTDFDLLWIDGDHSFSGCLGDIKRWWPRLRPGGDMLLHDCYLGSEVMDAVSEFLRTASDASVVIGAVNPRAYQRLPAGSMCHIRKLSSERSILTN